MNKVVLDANALMMPFQFHFNINAELERLLGKCEIIVPSSVISELHGLSQKNRKAKAGLKLAEKFNTFSTKKKGDEAVIETAMEFKAMVVTNDIRLLKKLKELKIPRIRLRSRNHLVLEQY